MANKSYSQQPAKTNNAGSVVAIILAVLLIVPLVFGFIGRNNSEKKVADLENRILSLEEQMNKSNNDVDDKLGDLDGKVDNKIDQVNIRLNDIGEQIAASDGELSNKLNESENELRNEIAQSGANLSDQITNVQNGLEEDISELEDSIVWYEHEVQFEILTTAREDAGVSSAIGWMSMSFINKNSTPYDCIDIGNGANPLLADYISGPDRGLDGYVMIDYKGDDASNGRYLFYMPTRTVVYSDSTEGSLYGDNHLYCFVYAVFAGSGSYDADELLKKIVPPYQVGVDEEGNPRYNDCRMILSDTPGIATARIVDVVTQISL